MVIIFGGWVGFTAYAEHQANPAVAAAGVHSTVGQHGGQGGPLRRLDERAVRRVVDGDVDRRGDGSYDSFTPMGGFGPLTGMMLGEVTPGGIGSGLYTILSTPSSPCSSAAS